jgi:tetratricopeptide (TPR) repeat protein
LETNMAQDTRTVTDRLYLRNTHSSRADALMDLRRHAEAVKDWDRAIELDEGQRRQAFRLLRAEALAHAGDHARATAEAAELTHDDQTPGRALFDAARVHGLAVLAVREAPLKEPYASKALALLRRAQPAGFFNTAAQVEHLRKDDDFAVLHDRADFKQFVADLEKKLAPSLAPPQK